MDPSGPALTLLPSPTEIRSRMSFPPTVKSATLPFFDSISVNFVHGSEPSTGSGSQSSYPPSIRLRSWPVNGIPSIEIGVQGIKKMQRVRVNHRIGLDDRGASRLDCIGIVAGERIEIGFDFAIGRGVVLRLCSVGITGRLLDVGSGTCRDGKQ